MLDIDDDIRLEVVAFGPERVATAFVYLGVATTGKDTGIAAAPDGDIAHIVGVLPGSPIFLVKITADHMKVWHGGPGKKTEALYACRTVTGHLDVLLDSEVVSLAVHVTELMGATPQNDVLHDSLCIEELAPLANRFAVSPRQDSIIVESGVIATESTLTCVEGWVERVVSGDGGRLVEGIRLSIVRWLNAVAIVGILADDNDDVRFGSALFVKQLVGLRDGFYGSTRGFAVGDIVPLVLVDVYGTSVVRAGGRIGNLVVRRKNRLHGEVRLVSETRDIQRASLADALPFSRIALIPRVGKIAFRKTPALPAFYACVKTDHFSLIVLNPVNGYRYSAQGRYGARYHFATVYRTVGERHHALGSRKTNVRTWLLNNVRAPNRVF